MAGYILRVTYSPNNATDIRIAPDATAYTGTITGSANTETGTLTFGGVTVETYWDGDARHATFGLATPAEAIAMFRAAGRLAIAAKIEREAARIAETIRRNRDRREARKAGRTA